MFAELVKPYERRVYVTALALLRNEADAQDVAQEAILKAFTNLRQFRGESRFSTWLIQITVNEARMRQRKQHAELFEPIAESPERGEKAPTLRVISPTGGKFLPKRWREANSGPCWPRPGQPGQKYREVFLLRDVEQMSIEETAQSIEYFGRQRQNPPAASQADAAGHSGARAGGWLVQPRAVRERKQAMVVNCEQVWQEISNYLEGEVNPELRAAMEAHFRECKHCTAVLDGTKNVLHLYGDDRSVGIARRFHRPLATKVGRIHARSPGNRIWDGCWQWRRWRWFRVASPWLGSTSGRRPPCVPITLSREAGVPAK